MEIVEELKRLKSLLDEGAIPQEEFTHLKKNLLNVASTSNTIPENSATNAHLFKKQKFRKVWLIVGVLAFSILAVLGATNYKSIREVIAGLQKKSNAGNVKRNQ
jgi:tripartite-type tricarboxylate transporter receptor subunit TctC